ncbi:hypothetical protein N431DRAFT_432229 [Stipitochalara longipes BDJ]|nr:hypothetical protein N431DRAFT_432229 [Stipitochalara longipes BDJ]
MDRELQIRSHAGPPGRFVSSGPRYPLSLDQRIRQGEQFRHSKAQLEAALLSIKNLPPHGSHSGQPNCERCAQKKNQMRAAYQEYYLSSDPDAWSSNLPQYRASVAEKFNNPNGYLLEEVHTLFQSAFREHLKQDLCKPVEKDTPQTFSLKSATAHQFDSGRPTADILSDYATAIENIAPNSDAAAFASAINNSRSQEERAHIYMNYYCRPAWADSPQQKAFKAKYARMFESLVPHDEVLAAMNKEAADSHASKIDVLQREISELQMAQSAHSKAKAKKEEKHERMILNREPSPKMVQCSLDGCANEVNLLADTIECAICEWLHRKGGRGRYVYCSVEHADEDFDEHDHHEHACCMGNRCVYYPQTGPPGDTDAVGICEDCEKEEFFSLFCSEDCFHHNLDEHREIYHESRRIPSMSDTLDLFQPADDMEIISQD